MFTLVHPDGKTEPLVIGLPGDREIDAQRLEAAVSPPRQFHSQRPTSRHPLLVKGYLGPQHGRESASGVRYLVDPRGHRHPLGDRRQVDAHVVNPLPAGTSPDGTIDVAEIRG